MSFTGHPYNFGGCPEYFRGCPVLRYYGCPVIVLPDKVDPAMTDKHLPADIASTVRRALNEDLGTGDLTARLLPEDTTGAAEVVSRDNAILCGAPWFD